MNSHHPRNRSDRWFPHPARGSWRWALTVGLFLIPAILSAGKAASRSAQAATVSANWSRVATLPKPNEYGWSTVGSGIVDRQEWAVYVKAERQGICFEATLLLPDEVEASGAGQCSKPVLARGIFLFEVEPGEGGKNSGATVVGGAFNRAVDRVELEGFDGNVRTLPLRRSTGDSGPRRFSYVAFAVGGVLCARRVMTLHEGRVVWSGKWQEFSRSVKYGSRVDLPRLCLSS